MNKYLKIALKGALFALLGAIISKLFTYLYRLVIARFLGVEEYGVISLALAVLSFALVFSVMGMNQGVMRMFSYYHGKNKREKALSSYYSARKIVLFLSLFFALSLFLLSDFLAEVVFKNPSFSKILKILSLLVPFMSLNEIIWALFMAEKKPELLFYINYLLDKVIRLVLTFLALFIGLGVIGVAYSYLISGIITFFLATYFAKKQILNTKFRSENLKKELLNYSIPLMFAGVISTIFLWTDTVLLGIFKSAKEVGLYNAAIPTANLINLPAIALGSFFVPLFTEILAKKKHSMLKSFTSSISRWIYIAALPLLFILLIFGQDLLIILFGKEFGLAYIALVVLALKEFSNLPISVSSWIIASYGKSNLLLKFSLFGTILNIILNILLIPKFGIFGAGLATLISSIFFGSFIIFRAKKISGFFPADTGIYKPLIASLLSSILIFLIDRLLFATTPFYAIFIYAIFFVSIYFSLIYILRGFTKEDKELMEFILKRMSKLKLGIASESAK
jgi:O-antigen/teichoic acid export membrane protein